MALWQGFVLYFYISLNVSLISLGGGEVGGTVPWPSAEVVNLYRAAVHVLLEKKHKLLIGNAK